MLVMADHLGELASHLASLDARLAALSLSSAAGQAIVRWRADAAALRFHLGRAEPYPILVAILGGTGTGKSTLVNRLLDANVSAASFRRTFTAGPVAIARDAQRLPPRWLGVDHQVAAEQELPVRGRTDALVVVPVGHELTERITLVDTPDLDGDQPLHHAQADRVFRWAQAVLFLVTPEKYQMTELLPYYRLARRYELPSLFVMNKCETEAMFTDYREQLEQHDPPDGQALAFAIPRDDAAYEPPADAGLGALRAALQNICPPEPAARERGLVYRSADLLDRLADQVLAPLSQARREADQLIDSLRSMETPEVGIDVNPITQQLQRRLQQRSVLYLMGPGRVLDRVRQVPGLLVRMPRTAWDWMRHGRVSMSLSPDSPLPTDERDVPDFGRALADQFTVLQSRIDDVIRSTPLGERWLTTDDAGYRAASLDAAGAGKIAEEELADLKDWLEKRWNATPRDTALLLKVLKHLPGGQKLTQWSEAAPYLLAIIVATHHTFFGHIDLMILGGWSLATWVMEKLSNEVAGRTRIANRRIAQRFAELAHEQIDRACQWLDQQAPSGHQLDDLQKLADEASEVLPSKP